MIKIEVTAAIIQMDDKFVLTQRPEYKLNGDKNHNGLRWEFPGGKIEAGESKEDCLKREIKEEMGADIDYLISFAKSVHKYGTEKEVTLHAFLCQIPSGEIQNIEINDWKALSPSEMSGYDVTEADLPFIEELMFMFEEEAS